MTTASRSTVVRTWKGGKDRGVDPTASAKVRLLVAGLAETVWLLALVWMALRAVAP